MIPVDKALRLRMLACRRAKELGTRPDMSIKVKRKLHDMRIVARIVRVRSTEQFVRYHD